ncbi:helix-turn-helix domain-containing protein [Paenibacillus oryzisoli]|uniref:helix-turn-helix domain-containing protein n=1 Tax=Paenibacillus oryzisoli TaxID=1850517 RepID=UPI003D2D662C
MSLLNLPAQLQLQSAFGKVTCEKSWKWDTTTHPLPDYDIWYVWGGEGQMTVNEVYYPLSGGTCFLFRPGDRTRAFHNSAKPLTVTFIHFDLPNESRPNFPERHRHVRDTLLFEAYLNRYVLSALEAGPHNAEERAMLLSLLLHQLEREDALASERNRQSPLHSRESAAILELIHYLRQHPSEPHPIHELAESVRLSPRYFSQKFKQLAGETVEHFLIRIKIERAEHLLRYNGMNVSEVAEALGYRNIYFFSKQFKQYRGFPPSKVRSVAAKPH